MARPGGDDGWRAHLPVPTLGGTRARVALVAGLVLVPATLLAMHYGRIRLDARVPAADSAPPAGSAGLPRQTDDSAARALQPAGPATGRTAASARYEREFVLERRPPAPAASENYERISDAKRAYREERLSKRDYRRVVAALENAMEREIDQAKRDYRAETISKQQYRERVEAIKRRYQ